MRSGRMPLGREFRAEAGVASVRVVAVSKDSHSTDACDRLTLSGIAGHYSGHPIRTLFRPRGRRRHCSRACPLSRAAVPFGQWNVCNASWAPPDFGQPGRLWIEAKPLVYLRSAAIAGPFGAVSRCGQPGSLGSSSPAAGSPAACLNQGSLGEPSLRCSAWWRTPCPGRRSRRLTCL